MNALKKEIAQKEWHDYDADDYLSAEEQRMYRRIARREMKQVLKQENENG